jgi:hypothetical protein
MQLFIIYVATQQLQSQLQTAQSVIGNNIMDRHKASSRVNCRSTMMQKNKQTKMIGNDNYKHRALG